MVGYLVTFEGYADAIAEMEEEDEEEDEGMTAEQKGMPLLYLDQSRADSSAQLATSMPIARALLKDVHPPISDTAIADSLWHYWFDVDKAVAWLRKDWEKKGKFPSLFLYYTSLHILGAASYLCLSVNYLRSNAG
jgi:hypothetical protein